MRTWRVRWMALLALVAGCDRLLGFSQLPPVDSPPPCASTLTPGDYSAPVRIFVAKGTPTLAMDETVMYMAAMGTINVSHDGGAWSAPAAVTTLDAPLYYEDRPSLFYDAQTIFFTRHKSSGGFD